VLLQASFFENGGAKRRRERAWRGAQARLCSRANGRRSVFFPDFGMSSTLFAHTSVQRGGLFGVVTGAHVLFLSLLLS
jgi:hypothetical protein